jgi:hypothetical protein
MNEPANLAGAVARARVGASSLALGQRIDAWSLLFTGLALAGLFWAVRQPSASLTQACLLLTVLAGAVQKGLALRVAFDAAIFLDWAERWRCAADAGESAKAIAEDLSAFDQALAAAGLRAAPGDPVPDLDLRLRGAMKLLRRQSIAFAVQFTVLLVAALAIFFAPAA